MPGSRFRISPFARSSIRATDVVSTVPEMAPNAIIPHPAATTTYRTIISLAANASHAFDFVFGDDLAAAKRKGKSAKVEVRVLTDLKGTRQPTIKVRGKVLAGGMQNDGISSFVVDDVTFVKGENAVEIIAPEVMTLSDFAVHVTFRQIVL